MYADLDELIFLPSKEKWTNGGIGHIKANPPTFCLRVDYSPMSSITYSILRLFLAGAYYP